MPYQQILQKYSYYGIFACRIHICDENSSKYMPIRVFLHAEFISAMKTVQNPMIFMKNAKK